MTGKLKEKYMNGVCCSECLTMNYNNDNYCIECGHKLRKIDDYRYDKNYCSDCGSILGIGDKYCECCGSEVNKKKKRMRKCGVCGEKISMEDKYCYNCGHNNIDRSSMSITCTGSLFDIIFCDNETHQKEYSYPKKCPNCSQEYQRFFNYCECCGEKLETKKKIKFKLF